MPVLLLEERVLGQAVPQQCDKLRGPRLDGVCVGRGRVKQVLCASECAVPPASVLCPIVGVRVPSEERGFACLKLQGPPNPSAVLLQQAPCFSRNVKFDGR